MNIASMLSIPLNLELAVALIKIGRTRKIDVGCITKLDGEKLTQPQYYLENAGIGLDGQLNENFYKVEHGDLTGLLDAARTIFDYFGHKTRIVFDKKEITVRSPLIEVSNGPHTGIGPLFFAPNAKLNDHRLTVSVFKMNKLELFFYFLRTRGLGKLGTSQVERHKSKSVKIYTPRPQVIHADARIFGTTPVEIKILPNALNIITGFPLPGKSSLEKRTLLDP